MSTVKNKKWYQKKRWIVLVLVAMALVAFRIALPSLVKGYVNKVLSEIPGYDGSVEDIDMALFRGAYVIKELRLDKVDATTKVPFLHVPNADISIEWSALFKGRIVSEIILTGPEVIYVLEDQQDNPAPDPEIDDWTKALTELVPVDINRLQVNSGKIAFVQVAADPNIDLHIYDIGLLATNLRNVTRKGRELPSKITGNATSIGGGTVSLDGRLDLIKTIPDVDVSFSLENADMTAFNDFTKKYAEIDFSEGQLNLYSEIAIADGYLKGYLKPLLKNARLIGKDDGFLSTLWEGFVGFFKFVLKNKKNDTLATEVPIEGDLNQVEGKVWPTVFNLIENGWFKAFTNSTDGDIDFDDALRAKEGSD